jgi:hypothetical protein
MTAFVENGYLVSGPEVHVHYATPSHFQTCGSNKQSVKWATVNSAAIQNTGQPITNIHGELDDTGNKDPAVAAEWQRMQVQLFVCAQEGRRDRNHPDPKFNQVTWDQYTEWTRQIWTAVDLYGRIGNDEILNHWKPNFDEMDRIAGLHKFWDFLPSMVSSMGCDKWPRYLSRSLPPSTGAEINGFDGLLYFPSSPTPPPTSPSLYGANSKDFEQFLRHPSSSASPPVHGAETQGNEQILKYPAPPMPSPNPQSAGPVFW